MASIYKRKQDRHKKRTCWFIGYKDHAGRQRTKKGFTDRTETERLAVKLEENAKLIRQGLKEPDEEERLEAKKVTIDKMVLKFKAYLEQRDVSPKQISETVSRLNKLIAGAKIQTIAAINADRVQVFLKELRDGGLSKQTSNHYLRTIQQFALWLVRTRKLPLNPLIEVRKLNTQTDRRHDRRPLGEEEFSRLIAAAEAGIPIESISGTDRAIMYVLAAWTGYRKSELGSLTPASLQLDANPPTATIEASYSKRRRMDTQVLHPELARRLKLWLADRKPAMNEILFPVSGKIPGGVERKTSKMMRLDLEAARNQWIDEVKTAEEKADRERTDFLKYEDSRGKFADFHANRHTFITNLSRAKVSPKVAQELARHSDIRLTLGIYTHTDLTEKQNAVDALPKPWEYIGSKLETSNGVLCPQTSQPVETSSAKASVIESSELLADSGVVATCREESLEKSNTPIWVRTRNLRFRRPMLYPIELWVRVISPMFYRLLGSVELGGCDISP